jgi:hypothetical protein
MPLQADRMRLPLAALLLMLALRTGAEPYAAHTVQLPIRRPYISLTQYAGARSDALLRLQEQVDDVVSITAALPAGTSYSDLIAALSNHYEYSPVDSVILFRLTGNSRYIDQAIRMVDLYVTSERALIAAGANPKVAADSYLNVGAYLSELSLTFDYGFERLTAAQRAAWSSFAEQAIHNIWNPTQAAWGSVSRPWSGWAVNDPGNNYFYSFMKATGLWALASGSRSWIDFLQTRQFPQLVAYYSLLAGGGSREGTGYGTALGSLFENYAYWKDSTGEDLSAGSTHARDTIEYWLHATVPTFEYFAPIGDQSRSSMPALFDYQRKLVLEAVALNPKTPQAMHGTWWLARARLTDGGDGWITGRMRYGFNFRYDLLAAAAGVPEAPQALMYDAIGAGAVFARSDWTAAASWLHLVAGRYDQSHAHQDQGSFSFFKGTWLTVTANVLSHSGINQGTEVHNVLRFDSGSRPVPQNHCDCGKTVVDSGGRLQVSANLSPAFTGSAGKVTHWTRDFDYARATHTLTVHDRCSVMAGITPVWQLHLPVQPVLQADGSYRAGKLHIVPQIPSAPRIDIVGMHGTSTDYEGGFRLELRGPADSCEFLVSLTAG